MKKQIKIILESRINPDQAVMKKKFFIALIAVFGGLADFSISAPSYYSLKDYPDLGLRMKVLGNSTAEPLPQCKTFTYTLKRGSETLLVDMFDPQELWYSYQHAGTWRDENGNRLIIGRATMFPPQFKEKHVPREFFKKVYEQPELALNPTNSSELVLWIKVFAGVEPGDPEPLRQRNLNLSLQDAIFFKPSNSTLICAFRLKTRKASGLIAPSDWYCAVLTVADGTPLDKVKSDFESQFLANISAIQTGTVENKLKDISSQANASVKNSQNISGSPVRDSAKKSIANMKDWWFAETKEYIFISNIKSSTGRSLIKDLQMEMPVLHKAFSSLIAPVAPTPDAAVVRIYEDSESYKTYVGKEMAWSLGVWMPDRRELVILAQEKDKEKTLAIIRHEGFHQYLFFASGMQPNAPWFDEGHACLFEEADIDRSGRIQLKEGTRCDILLKYLDECSRFIPSLIKMDHKAFYSGTVEQRILNYTTAWGLVYYLRKGAPSRKQNSYAAIPDIYLKAIASGKEPEKATEAAFSGINMQEFQEDFTEFWKNGRQAARKHDPISFKP